MTRDCPKKVKNKVIENTKYLDLKENLGNKSF